MPGSEIPPRRRGGTSLRLADFWSADCICVASGTSASCRLPHRARGRGRRAVAASCRGLPLLQVALMACAGGPTPFFHSLLIARLGETCVLEETSVGAYGIILRSSRRGCGHGISTTLGTRSRRMRSRRARIPGESPRCANTRRSRCSSPGTTATSRTWSARTVPFSPPSSTEGGRVRLQKRGHRVRRLPGLSRKQ